MPDCDPLGDTSLGFFPTTVAVSRQQNAATLQHWSVTAQAAKLVLGPLQTDLEPDFCPTGAAHRPSSVTVPLTVDD
jgi:hypothetical protein